MTHLRGKNKRSLCGQMAIGDSSTINFQQCTCSACQMHRPELDEYLATLEMPSFRDKARHEQKGGA